MGLPISRRLQQVGFLLIILIGYTASASLSLQSITAKIPSKASMYYSPEARVLFEDEFESGGFSAWNGTYSTVADNATITSSCSYDGFYNGRFQTGAASGVRYAYSYFVVPQNVSEVYARGYFYFVDGLSLDDNDDRFGLIGFEVGGQLTATFRVYRSGSVDRFDIVGINGLDTVHKNTDAVYPAEGQWYCLELYMKVHSERGEYRAWIDGVEQITITNLNTTRYGTAVSRVRLGLTYTANVQHYVEVYTDCVVVSTRYVGQLRNSFGVIGTAAEISAIRNFYWLFGNQSIKYEALLPSEVLDFADVSRFGGLVIWTDQGGYNTTAIGQFAQTGIVISHVWDFTNVLYPILSDATQVASTNTVTYVRDWGNFRSNDLVEMRNETGNTNQLTTVLAPSLSSFGNVSYIAQYDANRIAFFHMNGTQPKSGFYVMDLHATTPETEWAGIWHLFPAIKMVKDFPTGKYARWFAKGIEWPDINWINTWMINFSLANSDVVRMASIGTSVKGRPINAFFIGKGARYDIVDAAMHGFEKAPVFAVLRLAEVIVQDYHAGGYWNRRLEEYTIIIIPVLNPDGYVLNSYENANGKNLNREFPPDANTTEPEAWALRWLMGNYTPVVYVNNHEGRWQYPLDIIYGKYEANPQLSFTLDAISCANATFMGLRHWGYYTDSGLNVWIGKMRKIWRGGFGSMPTAYASWKYGASTFLAETFVWSSNDNGVIYKARKGLWANDYYVQVNLAFLMHLDKLIESNFIVYSDAKIRSTTWTGQLYSELDASELTSPSFTKIYVGDRGKPLVVRIDGVNKTEGDDWAYSSRIITVTGAKNGIEIGYG